MKRNFGIPRSVRQNPGEDSFMVMLAGVGLALGLTVVLWVMLGVR